MSPRKRKRQLSSPEPEPEENEVVNDGLPNNDQLENEREIWEAFREEHFEAIEQLPLTLHRQYSLMQELEQQSEGHMADLLPVLKTYISTRQEMVPQTISSGDEPSALKEEQPSSPLLGYTISGDNDLAQSKHNHVETNNTSPNQAPGNANGNRERLSRVAWLVEELLRSCEEKVNVAQAAHNSVDRHVRILEQAIKEQEISISMGARPGHLPAWTLPDLVAPKWTRNGRSALNLTEDEDLRILPTENTVPTTLGIAPTGENGHSYAQPTRVAGKRGRGRKGRPGRAKSDAKPDVPLDHETTLTITLPALYAGADTVDQTYCICDQGSFGEMIGCDGPKCEREWYHLKCVGLDVTPPGKWYCPDCQPRSQRKRK